MAKRNGNWWATHLTWITIAMFGALLAMFYADPYHGQVAHELWAINRKWQFYLLVIVAIGGVLATWVARIAGRRRHRVALLAAWVVAVTMITLHHSHRLAVMIQMIREHG